MQHAARGCGSRAEAELRPKLWLRLRAALAAKEAALAGEIAVESRAIGVVSKALAKKLWLELLELWPRAGAGSAATEANGQLGESASVPARSRHRWQRCSAAQQRGSPGKLLAPGVCCSGEAQQRGLKGSGSESSADAARRHRWLGRRATRQLRRGRAAPPAPRSSCATLATGLRKRTVAL